MKKLRSLMLILIIGIISFLIPTIVKAEVLDNSKISSSISRMSSDGSIKVNLEGLTLDTSKEYKFSLTKNQATEPSDWYNIITYTDKTAEINLTASTKVFKDVLSATETGYLYIKDASDDTLVVSKLPINLKLPYYDTIDIIYKNKSSISIDRIYNLSKASWQAVKITDTNIINEYLSNNREVSSILKLLPTTAPTSNWIEMTNYTYDTYSYDVHSYNLDNGLYLIWVQMYGDNCRTVYGYTVYDALPIDEEAPTVKSISVTSPTSGTYKTSQTVKIRVNFSETITGTSVPTLKIKFGDSVERSVSNGTIKESYIEYSYNIQDGDVGQLATVSLSGGTIKDSAGNDAKLSCPIISGYTIKANMDGTTTNNTDNQDKTNNNTTPNNNNGSTSNSSSSTNNPSTNNGSTSNSSSSTSNPSTNNSGTSNNSSSTSNQSTNNSNTSNKDTTTAPGKIPQTGEEITVIVAIIAVAILAVFGYIKCRKYKGI